VRIDYGARTLTLYDSTQVAPGNAALAIDVADGTPFVHAEIGLPGGRAVPVRLLSDTGATGSLSLNTPTVDRHRLDTPASAVLPLTSGALLAGRASSLMRRLPALTLGNHRLLGPIAALARETEGDRADSTNDGYVGGEVLERFTMWVDYAHRRLVLTKGRATAAPFEFDMSGLSLTSPGPTFEVRRVRLVLAGSPAARAGFAAGDTLLTIDGRSAATRSLDELRSLFRRPGRRYRVVVLRDGVRRELALAPRRLL
jgi:hypothetical protein